MSTISSFRSIENQHDVYIGKDCMKRLCECLREYAIKIINFKMLKLLTIEQQESNENAKKYRNVRDHGHYTGEYRVAARSICKFKYSVPIKIPIVFHNGFNYDCHFIIKELAEEF